LSQFYDGVKIFDSKVADFWPLLIKILNLPPNLRNIIGIGSFLLSIFANKLDCAAEDYLFSNCFVEELNVLKDGIIINNIYFVQVRLIQHCLDTKAVGKQLKVHETNSTIGCPLCRVLPGSYRSELGKCVYSGVRFLLPIDNWLRYVGRTKLCCPPNFYGVSAENSIQHSLDNRESYQAYSKNVTKINENLQRKELVLHQRFKFIKGMAISCKQNISEIDIEKIRTISETQINMYQWFHSTDDDSKNPFFYGNFSSRLYFVHCDLRPQVDLVRRTQTEFANDGINADQLSRNRNIPSKDRHVNGVKASWPFSKLNYANISRDISYDGFHTISGICKHFISILKGERSNAKLNNYCAATKTFPFLYEMPIEVPWTLSKADQYKVDAWIDAILIPKSYSDSFQLERLFQATGYVRSKSFIDAFSMLINYINLSFFTIIPDEYRKFFSMLGSILCALLENSFCDSRIEELHNKFIECMGIYEGLFSEKECMFLFHEGLHLARHIRIMGPLHGWWTYSGERAMSFIKKFVPKGGGKSFDKTCMYAYNASEEAITENSFSENFYNKEMRFTLNSQTKQLEFDFNIFYFLNPKTFRKPHFFPEFSSLEKESLISVLLNEVYKIAISHDNAIQISSLYRLLDNHNIHCRTNNIIFKSCTFSSWLYMISLFFDDGRRKLQIPPLSIDQEHVLSIISTLIEGSSICEYDGQNNANQFILRNEIRTATSIIALLDFQTNIVIYRNAFIFGNRFSARDETYSEKFEMIKDNRQYGSTTTQYKYSNDKNNLQELKNWSTKDDYSSWCRYKILNTEIDFNKKEGIFNTKCRDCYGRLNYFFRFFCETDDIIHGLGIANIVPRMFEKYHSVDKITCSNYTTMSKAAKNDSEMTFIPVTNIYASPILIAPFDHTNKPIVISSNKDSLLRNNLYSETNQISHIFAMDLIPSAAKEEKQFQKSKYKIYNSFSKDKN
jgi:hypothetical protein